MKIRNIRLSNVTITNRPVVGESVFTTTGTYTWVCPPEVYNVSVVCIGPGAVANALLNPGGGPGGALAWKNNIPVTPGNVYTVYNGTYSAYHSNDAYGARYVPSSAFQIENLANNGINLAVMAQGSDWNLASPMNSYFIIGDGGGYGGWSMSDGQPGVGAGAAYRTGCGGAGGYTGNGGRGGSGQNGTYLANAWLGANLMYGQPGQGGGGGGGGGYDYSPTDVPSPNGMYYDGISFGGGTGIYGQGENGVGGDGIQAGWGNVLVGNSGDAGSAGTGALFGGGIIIPNPYGITSSPGAVRIIWPGAIRKFPNTNTSEAGVVYSYNTNQ
jgi:hypothetical protein